MNKTKNYLAQLTRWTRYVLAFTFLLLISITVKAHELRPAIIDLNFIGANNLANNRLSIDIVLNIESLIAGIGPEHDNTDTSENAELYQALRAMQAESLITEFRAFETRFLAAIELSSADDTNITLSTRSINIPPVGDLEVPRDTTLVLDAELPNNITALHWQWAKAFGESIVRANSDKIDLSYAALLSPGQQSDLIQFTQVAAQSKWSILANYIVVGFEHILPKGLDHILFVIGLFLLTTKWRALVFQVTAFTLAHSVTLALGVNGLLRISPAIIEPLIALSIVVLCVENLITNKLNKWRIPTVFIFGLLHGLGFASVLDQVGLDSNHFLIALLGFNVGVELGQIVVIAICFITVGFWFGNKAYYRKFISVPASVVVGLIGLFWFIQRTLL